MTANAKYLAEFTAEIRELLAKSLETRPLLTYGEAADRLNISESTVRGFAKTGELAVVLVGSKTVRIEAREVDRFIAKRRREAGDGE